MQKLRLSLLFILIITLLASCASTDFKRIHKDITEVESPAEFSPLYEEGTLIPKDDSAAEDSTPLLKNWDALSEDEKNRIYLTNYAEEILREGWEALSEAGYTVKQVLYDILEDNTLLADVIIEFPENLIFNGDYYSQSEADKYLEDVISFLDGDIDDVVNTLVLSLRLQYEQYVSRELKTMITTEKCYIYTSADRQWKEADFDEITEE